MSRYIRQAGKRDLNATDDRQIPEWESIYSCYNWTETYNPVPRFEVNSNEFSAFKLVISGYCAPSCCRTLWKTNNTSRYYTKFSSTSPVCSCLSTDAAYINTWSCCCIVTSMNQVTPGQTVELEIYPGVSDGISWRGDVMSPQTCCYSDFGGRGTACVSWNDIKYVEICLEGFSTLSPTSCNSNWHVYGKRRV